MGGHVGRLVSRLMNRTERSEEAQARLSGGHNPACI